MSNHENKETEKWLPRKYAVIFADEDVDGLMSAAIVARRYMDNFQIKFVTARSLSEALRRFIRSLRTKKRQDTSYVNNLDVHVVDVGINRASIDDFSSAARSLVEMNVRIHYFDSHSNKYNGHTLLPQLEKSGVKVYLGSIGTAAASIIHEVLGSSETSRLQKLGALSDREVSFSQLKGMNHEKEGLRMLQAAVAWGAWKERSFLHRISRDLVYNPDLDFTSHEQIREFSNLANRHRDNLYRHVIKNSHVLEISSNPRILAVMCLDRTDFGKARGTIAGHLAGEWSAVILLITKSENPQFYSISIRNHYRLKVDLERLGQLALAESAGGSKGAYRITLRHDKLIPFIVSIQQWAYGLRPPWVRPDALKRRKG